MEQIYNQLIGQGVVGGFLVLVIIYHLRTVKDLKQEMKDKSIAHASNMKDKETEIKELNEKIHELGINAVTSIREWTNALKTLLK